MDFIEVPFRILKPCGLFILLIEGDRDMDALKVRALQHPNQPPKFKRSCQLRDNLLNTGFTRAYGKNFYANDVIGSKSELLQLLHQRIIIDKNSATDFKVINEYCDAFPEHRILLNRHRIVLIAQKSR